MFTLHHAGIVVSDLDDAMKSFIENLGYRFFQFEVNEGNASLSESSATFSLSFGIGQLGLSFVELIQPVSGATLYSRYLDENGPGLHHLGYSALDLGAARKQFASSGYNCLQNGKINGLVEFSYYQAPDLACIVEPLQFSCDFATFLLQNAKPYPQQGS